MKKILYAALGLSIFIFGGSQLLTQAASLPNGNFGVNDECFWEYNPADGSFVVVGPVNSTCTLKNDSKDAWANYGSQIKSFKINSGVKAPTNMEYFFQSLTDIKTIDVNDLDVSASTGMYGVFSNLSSQTNSGIDELDLSKWNTSKVEDMGAMFLNVNVKSLKLGQNFNTSNVTNMGSMFQNSAFEELKLDFDTTKVTDMMWMFQNAEYLNKLDVSSFYLSGSVNIENMFQNIGSGVEIGTEIIIGTGFLGKDSQGYSNGPDLSNLNFPHKLYSWYDHNYNNGSYDGFYVDHHQVGDLIDWYPTREFILTPAYEVSFCDDNRNCEPEYYRIGTQIVTAGKTLPDKPGHTQEKWIGTVYYAGGSTGSIEIPVGEKSSEKFAGYNNTVNALISYNLELRPQWTLGSSTSTFGSGCQFSFDAQSGSFVVEPVDANIGCQLGINDNDDWNQVANKIKSFTIKSGVKAPTQIGYWFGGLRYVENLDVNNLDVSKVENMNTVFAYVGKYSSGVVELDLSNWYTSNVTDMSYMFYDSNIQNLKLGNGFDTSNVENFEGMFKDAKNLKKLDVSSFDTSKMTNNNESMFLNVGANVDERIEIIINTGFAGKSQDFDSYEFPYLIYHLGKDSQGNDIIADGGDLYSPIKDHPSYKVTLTPIYKVEFDYNYLDPNTNSTGSDTKTYRLGSQIDTSIVNATRSGFILEKWTDTKNGENATITIPAGTTSQSGYGHSYFDSNGFWYHRIDLYAQWKEVMTGNTIGSGCKWTFNSLSGSFVVEPATPGTTCELENLYDNNPWYLNRNDIKSFTIKPNVKAPENMDRFFEELRYIETIDVNNLDVSSTTGMFCAFCGLSQSSSGLNELDLSSWNTPKVESMHAMFSVTNIKYLKLGTGFDTSNVNDFKNMFAGSAFEELILNFNTSKVNFNMELMFAGATKLKKLDISSFDMNKVLQPSNNPAFPGGYEMFYKVGKDIPEGTTIKLNETFAAKVSGLNFPATGYKLECDGWEDFFYKNELQKLSGCSGTGTLTPAYYVYFDYNGGNSGDAGRIFLAGKQIDTSGITPTKSGHILLKWTDTQDVTSATIEIPAGAKSQTGYGAYYTDNNPKTLYAQWKEEYKVTSGDNQTYTKGSNTDIIIETNTDEIPNGKIWLDGVEIPKTGYSHNLGLGVSGFLVLTLNSGYLDTLPAGDHTVKMMFYSSSNGDYTITATLTIKNQTTGGGGGSGGRKRNTTPVILSDSEESSEQLTGDVQEPQEEKTEFELAYEFAFKHGITTMDTIEKANMTGNLTRIAMAKMLSYYAINVLGQTPDTTKVCEFDDVSAQDDLGYNNGVTLTCQLGFMGVGMKNFRPYDTVIRAEFVTALSRMLFGTPDGNPYYVTHLQKLKSEGIIKNDNPNMEEVRGYTMIMLMRSKE